MKKRLIIGLPVIGLLFFFGCERYDMIVYGEGGEINFRGRYQNGSRYYWSDDEKYLVWENNFGVNPQGERLLQDTLILGVKVMGVTAGQPRKVVLKANPPEKNALEVIFAEEYYVPADTGVATFQVYVKRPVTRNATYTTELVFDYAQSDFLPGTIERQVFQLKAEDKVSLELWGITEEFWEYEPVMLLGEWSEAKMRFMLTLFGCVKFEDWYDYYFYDILLDNMVYECLKEYKSDPSNPPFIDENTGEWIEFPDMSEWF